MCFELLTEQLFYLDFIMDLIKQRLFYAFLKVISFGGGKHSMTTLYIKL